MVSASDIQYFFEGNSRAENDSVNSIRENCLLVLNDSDHPFFDDTTYGDKWRHLRREFELMLNKITTQPWQSYILSKEANRKNHDFDLLLMNDSETEVITWEFKSAEKNQMPQFFTPYDYDRYFPETFAEYWYDKGGLDAMLAMYPTKLTKPPRDEYLREVYKYIGEKTQQPFFKQLYLWDKPGGEFGPKTEIYKKKNAHVQRCINEYLITYLEKFSMDKFREKVQSSQKDKIYGMWNRKTKKFEIFNYTKSMLTPTKINCVRLKHDLMIDTEDPQYQLKCLLRWKNHNGIGLPGYQISMVRKKDR